MLRQCLVCEHTDAQHSMGGYCKAYVRAARGEGFSGLLSGLAPCPCLQGRYADAPSRTTEEARTDG